MYNLVNLIEMILRLQTKVKLLMLLVSLIYDLFKKVSIVVNTFKILKKSNPSRLLNSQR